MNNLEELELDVNSDLEKYSNYLNKKQAILIQKKENMQKSKQLHAVLENLIKYYDNNGYYPPLDGENDEDKLRFVRENLRILYNNESLNDIHETVKSYYYLNQSLKENPDNITIKMFLKDYQRKIDILTQNLKLEYNKYILKTDSSLTSIDSELREIETIIDCLNEKGFKKMLSSDEIDILVKNLTYAVIDKEDKLTILRKLIDSNNRYYKENLEKKREIEKEQDIKEQVQEIPREIPKRKEVPTPPKREEPQVFPKEEGPQENIFIPTDIPVEDEYIEEEKEKQVEEIHPKIKLDLIPEEYRETIKAAEEAYDDYLLNKDLDTKKYSFSNEELKTFLEGINFYTGDSLRSLKENNPYRFIASIAYGLNEELESIRYYADNGIADEEDKALVDMCCETLSKYTNLYNKEIDEVEELNSEENAEDIKDGNLKAIPVVYLDPDRFLKDIEDLSTSELRLKKRIKRYLEQINVESEWYFQNHPYNSTNNKYKILVDDGVIDVKNMHKVRLYYSPVKNDKNEIVGSIVHDVHIKKSNTGDEDALANFLRERDTKFRNTKELLIEGDALKDKPTKELTPKEKEIVREYDTLLSDNRKVTDVVMKKLSKKGKEIEG